jgi:WD40 repeat protein/transcriptional regulator with XRE-family HTH domain
MAENQQLRAARKRKHWSQTQAAKACGVDLQTYFRWERGVQEPHGYNLDRLCEVFGAPMEELGYAHLLEVKREGETAAPPDELNGSFVRLTSEQVTALLPLTGESTMDQAKKTFSVSVDWGEAPLAVQFSGRDQERTRLQQWIGEQHCSLIAILGLGGIGKTSLAVSTAEQSKGLFSFVFWRSLQNAPGLDLVLRDCIHFLSGQPVANHLQDIETRISDLISLLQKKRCLLVLDNFETLLQPGDRAGRYRRGYEGYGKFLRRLGEGSHQSCLLLTSREKPQEIAFLEGETALVRSYQLGGLNLVDGRAVLQDKGVHGEETAWNEFISHYDGNPLSLKLASQYIQEVFGGDIASFLADGEVLVNDVRTVLDQQFERLSSLEQTILYWLAIKRDAVSFKEVERDLLHPVPRRELQAALLSLHRRYLTETQMNGVTLHNVIMEYVISHLIERVCDELQTGQLFLFEAHALMMGQAKDYIRENQIELLLKPLLHQLFSLLGRAESEALLRNLLSQLRTKPPHQSGYAAGNILNLLVQSGYDLRGYDFSYLTVRQAYLQGASLPEVCFASADLTTSVFTDTFGSILSLALSVDGRLAAGTTNGEVRIWKTDGTPLSTCLGHTDWVRSVALSPDGKKVASGSHDQTIRLWDTQTGQCLRVLQDHTNRVRSVAFSPDGKQIVSGSEDQTIRFWDVETGQCLRVLQGHAHWIYTLAFSSDGRSLASGGEGQTVRVWEAETGQCLHTLQGHTGSLHALAFSPDGNLIASAGEDQVIRLWSVETGQCLHILQGHAHWIYTLAFHPNGEILASGSEDRSIRLWSVKDGQCLKLFSGHTSRVRSVAFSADGATMASGSEDQTIRLWEVHRSYCLKVLQGHRSWVRAVAFSHDGRILASGGDDPIIRLWKVENGQGVRTLQGRTDRIHTMAFSPHGEMIAGGGEDLHLYLWEARSGWELRALQGHTGWIHSIAFSPDGHFLVSGGNEGMVRLWDTTSGLCLKLMQGHTNRVRSVAFSPRADLVASGSEDREVRLWDARSGRCLKILQGHTNRVWSVAFHPDGRMLASAGHDCTVRLWETKTGECLHIFSGHTHRIWSVAWSSDGETIATGSEDRTVRLWQASSGRCLQVLEGHAGSIWSVAFCLNGRLVASGSDDGTVRLWDVQTGNYLRTFRKEQPYERMDITGVRGLTDAQKAVLQRLGAIETEERFSCRKPQTD